MKSVSIIVPCRNEQDNIVKLLEEVKKASPFYNVIVVDDSDDNETKMLALANGAKVIDGQHKGLGQAIIDGLKAISGDVAVVLDADLSHSPSKIPELIKACQNGYDMAIGSRYVKGGSIVGWSFKRRLISLVASAIAYPITRIRDNTSGFFAVNKASLDGVELKADSWKIMLEVLVKTGAKVVEVPIEFKDREAGKSKFNRKEVFAYLKHLIKLAYWKYIKGILKNLKIKYPSSYRLASFMIVGGIGYLVNMAVYYPLTLWFEKTVTFFGQEFYLPPFLVSSFVAITSNYILNKRFTFGDCKVKTAGYLKYLTTCSASLPLEMALIYLFVHFFSFMPIMAVAVAILIVFIGRFLVVSRIVWRKAKS